MKFGEHKDCIPSVTYPIKKCENCEKLQNKHNFNQHFLKLNFNLFVMKINKKYV